MKIAAFLFCHAICLNAAQPTGNSSSAQIVLLEGGISALREKIRVSGDAMGDASAAQRVVDTEVLLIKERQLIELRTKLREEQPSAEDLARRDLQQSINDATDEGERAALRAKYQAYQRVLALESVAVERAARKVATAQKTAQ